MVSFGPSSSKSNSRVHFDDIVIFSNYWEALASSRMSKKFELVKAFYLMSASLVYTGYYIFQTMLWYFFALRLRFLCMFLMCYMIVSFAVQSEFRSIGSVVGYHACFTRTRSRVQFSADVFFPPLFVIDRCSMPIYHYSRLDFLNMNPRLLFNFDSIDGKFWKIFFVSLIAHRY